MPVYQRNCNALPEALILVRHHLALQFELPASVAMISTTLVCPIPLAFPRGRVEIGETL